MDFLSKIGHFLLDPIVDAFQHTFGSMNACPPEPEAAQAQDKYQTVELREIQFHELIESSQRVPVGCYIQMHQVPELKLQELRRQLKQ